MISDATGGLPRYCHPYHGGWDVARIALDIPESHILFVCPVSCARIISLNAVKDGYKDRISVLALTEDDIVSGSYEEKTIAGALELLGALTPRPKALILYVSCIDAMLGNDHTFQTEEIMRQYPDVNCFVLKMCPITRYSGDLPLVALQHDMYEPLPKEKVPREKIVAFLGSNIAYSEDCELIRLLKDNGYRPLHIQAASSYEDYLAVRASSLNLCLMPFASSAGKMLMERFETPMLPYFAKYDFAAIRATLEALAGALSLPLPDLDRMEAETKAYLTEIAGKIHGTPLVIDSTATLFPNDLKKTLESCGFSVRRIYADDIHRTPPDVDSGSIVLPAKRAYKKQEDVIALGMAASSFEGAKMTAGLFYDNGWWGYDGLKRMGDAILQAYNEGCSSTELKELQRKDPYQEAAT